MKRRFILISLLLSLIGPLLITYSFLSVKKYQVRKQLKRELIHGVDRSELVLISLSLQEAKEKLDWEHAREFEFEGEMYDVVESKITEDSVKYWCWWDHEETKLNQKLATLLDHIWGNHATNQQTKDQMISFYKNLFVESLFQWKPAPRFHKSDTVFFVINSYESICLYAPSPPPQML